MTKRQNVMINDHIRQLWLSIDQRPFGLSRVSQKEIKIYFTK